MKEEKDRARNGVGKVQLCNAQQEQVSSMPLILGCLSRSTKCQILSREKGEAGQLSKEFEGS